MYLNSEVQAALDAAKAKINEHTRQAATDLAGANEALIAAMHLRTERLSSIVTRRAELEAEAQDVEQGFVRDLQEITTRIATIKRGMRDEEPANDQQGEAPKGKPKLVSTKDN